jgi:hypothetical protein
MGKNAGGGWGDVKKNGTVHQLYIKTSTLTAIVYTWLQTTVTGSILMFYIACTVSKYS